jgi:hypothetical protein
MGTSGGVVSSFSREENILGRNSMTGRHFRSIQELNNARSNDALGIDEARWVGSSAVKAHSQYRIEAALSSFLDIVDRITLYSSPCSLS